MMRSKPVGRKQLLLELEELRSRLDEVEGTLSAIRAGEVDALVVAGKGGERILTLKGADHPYRKLVENMGEGALNLTGEGLILFANRRVCEMLKAPIDRLIGSSMQAWIAKGSQDKLEALLSLGEDGKWRDDLVLAAADGREVPVQVSTSPLSIDELPDSLCIVLTDITELKRNQDLAQKALKENKDLLGELQHRAKNSFNMIYALIGFMTEASGATETKTALADLGTRVRAVSELYSLLFSAGSFAVVRLDDYCRRVAEPLVGLSGNLVLDSRLAKMTIGANEAAPIGLILSEVVTNAIKYAFPGGRRGTISVSLETTPAGGRLMVVDDGIGLPAGFETADNSGMGLKLINGLAEQIGATFGMESRAGTSCTLEFPLSARLDSSMPEA